MSKGGLEVNAPKKKKKIDKVPIRKRTITFANNLLKDPDQALELVASINLEENRQREKEWRSKAKHAPLVLDKEVDEAYNAQLKFKLKVVERITPDAQLLLDLKQGQKESKKNISWKKSERLQEKTQILRASRMGLGSWLSVGANGFVLVLVTSSNIDFEVIWSENSGVTVVSQSGDSGGSMAVMVV
ncbi:hypothetical protein Tco_0552027 [Tanacetum coccineum]